MTGKELWNLHEGDTLRFRESVSPVYTGVLYVVEYMNIDRGKFYLRNTDSGYVVQVGVSILLNHAYIVHSPYSVVTSFEHRLKLGDEAWVMCNNEPIKTEVKGIVVEYYNSEVPEITYVLTTVGSTQENLVFPTKEELLKSL